MYLNAKAGAVRCLSFPPIFGMVKLDVIPGALMIMARIENGNSEAASGLVYFLRVNEYGNES